MLLLLALTIHSAQGKTYNNTIAAIENNKILNNSKMWLVAISRHKNNLTVYVENKDSLKKEIASKVIEDKSALSLSKNL